jgi:hypothetical protein
MNVAEARRSEHVFYTTTYVAWLLRMRGARLDHRPVVSNGWRVFCAVALDTEAPRRNASATGCVVVRLVGQTWERATLLGYQR